MARIRIEYVWDDEANAWGFVVPALHIVGGGPGLDDARRRAREAIDVALEGPGDSDDSGEAEYLDVRFG